MKTKFQLASGPLSYLKEVTIDLEMKGKHFDQLVTADEDTYERVVLSILRDLMDEDPYQLTLPEMYHVFLMVKSTSLGHKISLNVRCHNVLRSVKDNVEIQRECGALNSFEYSLLESDVVYCPKDYKIPEIEFTLGGRTQRYEVRPPTMTQELDLLAYFQESGVNRESLLKDKEQQLSFAKHRILLHLRNKETGDSFFDRKQREAAVKDMAENSLTFMQRAGDLMAEVNSFGVSNKRMNLTCKECGGKVNFRLPLSSGLSV